MNAIFHAFSMEYKQIGVIAPKLVDLGFTHVQFPPIQTTRTLTEMDTELLQKQISQVWNHLKRFEDLCQKARQKTHLYPPHTFDYLLKQRIHYIRQPLLRDMYSYILSGVSVRDLIPYMYESTDYNYMFTRDGKIQDADVSHIVKKMTIAIGTNHPYFPLVEGATLVLRAKKADPVPPDTLQQAKDDYNRAKTTLREQSSQYKKRVSILQSQHAAFKQYHETIRHLSDLVPIANALRFAPYTHLVDTKHMKPKEWNKDIAKSWIETVLVQEFLTFPPWWLIYQPMELRVGNTFLGSKQEILNAIQACKSAGLSVIADIVINNLAAVAGERETWLPYESNKTRTLFDISDASQPFQDIQTLLRNAFGTDDLTMIMAPRDCKEGVEPTHCWMSCALPQLNQTHPVIQSHLWKFLEELKDVGISGVRIDAAAHLTPDVCQRVVSHFDGLSYIEYVGGSEDWRRFPSESYTMRKEDFAIGEDLYDSIFVPNGQSYRLVNYGSAYLRREPLDSIVMIVNHDHIMESIHSKVYGHLPSQHTYETSVAYLVQRIYGSVLLMPHDVEFPMVQHALDLRSKMRHARIVRESVQIGDFISIEKRNHTNERIFLVEINPHEYPIQTDCGLLEPYSFQVSPENATVYNESQNRWMQNQCFPRKKRSKRHTRKRQHTDG
jgi:hypothetical protein